MGLAGEERYLPQLVACALEFVAHGRRLGPCRAELPLRRLLRDAPSCGYRSLAHGWTGPQGLADWADFGRELRSERLLRLVQRLLECLR